MTFPFWLFATFNRNSNKSIQDVVVFLFRKSIYVRLRKTTLLRIVYCHFLASCIIRFVFRLGAKSNYAQKKRCVGELLGSVSVQTVYIFSPFLYFFRLFLSFFCLFNSSPPLLSSSIPLILFFPTFPLLIFALIPLLPFIYLPYLFYSFSLSLFLSLFNSPYLSLYISFYLLSLLYLLLFLLCVPVVVI